MARSRYTDPDMWVRACDRAVKCSAAAMVGVIGTNAVDVTTVDWGGVLTVGAFAALVSLLSSIATAGPRT